MVMYKWHTGGVKPCYKCSRWEGRIFMRLEDVPELPVHPNCTCTIEALGVVENKELLEIGSKLEKVRAQTKQDVADLTLYAGLTYLLERLVDAAKSLLDDIYQISMAADIFWENYWDLREADFIGADKYFHSKANAEAAQLGKRAETVAKFISDTREFVDYYTNLHLKKLSLEATIKDAAQDQRANAFGREKGRQNPNADVRDLVEIFRPEGLDDRY